MHARTSSLVALVGWVILIIGAVLSPVPILGLTSVLTLPVGALVFVLAVLRATATPGPRLRRWAGALLCLTATLVLAVLAVCTAHFSAWVVLGWQKPTLVVSPAEMLAGGRFSWVLVIALNLVAAFAFALGTGLRSRHVHRLTFIASLAPTAAGVVMALVGHGLPLTD